jgi:predicted neuraminidase
MPDSAGLLQPSLAATPRGVAAYLRDHRRRFVWMARLDPAAGAWSAPRATDLPNPDSAIEVFNDGGKVGLVYNPSRKDRGALALAFSDDGVRFDHGCTLVPSRTAGDAAYPAVTPMGDGWGLAFSIEGKHAIAFVRLDRAFLDACAAEPRS